MTTFTLQDAFRDGWDRAAARNGLLLAAGFLLVRYMSAALAGAAGIAATPLYTAVLLVLWVVAVLALSHLIVLAFRTFLAPGTDSVSPPLPVEEALQVTPRIAAGLLVSMLLFILPAFLVGAGGVAGVVLAVAAWAGVVYVLGRTVFWPVAVVRGATLVAGVRESWERTGPIQWRTVGVLVALGVVLVVAQGVTGVFVSAVPNGYISVFLQEAVSAFTTVLVIAVIASAADQLP